MDSLIQSLFTPIITSVFDVREAQDTPVDDSDSLGELYNNLEIYNSLELHE